MTLLKPKSQKPYNQVGANGQCKSRVPTSRSRPDTLAHSFLTVTSPRESTAPRTPRVGQTLFFEVLRSTASRLKEQRKEQRSTASDFKDMKTRAYVVKVSNCFIVVRLELAI